MANLRAGLIGLGMMGRHHARNLRSIEGVDLVAVADAAGDPHGLAGGLEVLDGVMVGERTNLAWRCHPRMGIRGNWQMCYHGGSTPPDHDIWWRLRNFALARRYIGPAVRG